MFAEEDEDLLTKVLTYLPWDRIPSLSKGSCGRLGDAPPLRVWRYGEGRVLVFQANIARYCALLPLNSLKQGLDGTDDRILALQAMIWAAAAANPARAYCVRRDFDARDGSHGIRTPRRFLGR